MVRFIFQFVRSMSKARSNSYRNDAEETRITEIKMDKEMIETLVYSESLLKSRTGCYRSPRKAQARRLEIDTRKLVSRDYSKLLEIVCEQRATSHFVFKCIRYVHC